jgi:secreted trypsin-like serine protease
VPRASRVLSTLGVAVFAIACGRGPAPSGRAATTESGEPVSADAPDDPAAYRATGAFFVRPFGSAFLECTGTAIAPRVVVTAAHCVTNLSKKRLQFTLNRDATAAPVGASVTVLRAYVHPDYDLRSTGSMHDIALAELEAPLESSSFERLLSAAEASAALRPDGDVELVGYGANARLPEKTAKRATIRPLRADEMTIGGPGEPQSCEGDSGGPAFVLNGRGARRIAGIVSRSANDATECVDGSIDTRVDAYSDWLAATLATIEADERRTK